MASPSTRSDATLQITRTLSAPCERLYRAWTEGEALRRWLAPGDAIVESAAADARVGGAYHVSMRGPDDQMYRLTDRYLELDRPHRIVLTWRWDTDPSGYESVVTVDLVERGRETELRLTHAWLATDQQRDGHRVGWESCLDKLAREVA